MSWLQTSFGLFTTSSGRVLFADFVEVAGAHALRVCNKAKLYIVDACGVMPCASAIRTNEFDLAAFVLGHALPDNAVQVFDLRVQLFYLPGLLSGCGENWARVLDELVLPQAYLVRMNVALGGDLVEGLLFSEGIQDHRGLDFVVKDPAAAAGCLVDAGFVACRFQ